MAPSQPGWTVLKDTPSSSRHSEVSSQDMRDEIDDSPPVRKRKLPSSASADEAHPSPKNPRATDHAARSKPRTARKRPTALPPRRPDTPDSVSAIASRPKKKKRKIVSPNEGPVLASTSTPVRKPRPSYAHRAKTPPSTQPSSRKVGKQPPEDKPEARPSLSGKKPSATLRPIQRAADPRPQRREPSIIVLDSDDGSSAPTARPSQSRASLTVKRPRVSDPVPPSNVIELSSDDDSVPPPPKPSASAKGLPAEAEVIEILDSDDEEPPPATASRVPVREARVSTLSRRQQHTTPEPLDMPSTDSPARDHDMGATFDDPPGPATQDPLFLPSPSPIRSRAAVDSSSSKLRFGADGATQHQFKPKPRPMRLPSSSPIREPLDSLPGPADQHDTVLNPAGVDEGQGELLGSSPPFEFPSPPHTDDEPGMLASPKIPSVESMREDMDVDVPEVPEQIQGSDVNIARNTGARSSAEASGSQGSAPVPGLQESSPPGDEDLLAASTEEDTRLSISVSSQLRISISSDPVTEEHTGVQQVQPAETPMQPQIPMEEPQLLQSQIPQGSPPIPSQQLPSQQQQVVTGQMPPPLARIPTLDLKALQTPLKGQKKRNSSGVLNMSPQMIFTPTKTAIPRAADKVVAVDRSKSPRAPSPAADAAPSSVPNWPNIDMHRASEVSHSGRGDASTREPVQSAPAASQLPPVPRRRFVPRFSGPDGFFKGVIPPSRSVSGSSAGKSRASMSSNGSVPKTSHSPASSAASLPRPSVARAGNTDVPGGHAGAGLSQARPPRRSAQQLAESPPAEDYTMDGDTPSFAVSSEPPVSPSVADASAMDVDDESALGGPGRTDSGSAASRADSATPAPPGLPVSERVEAVAQSDGSASAPRSASPAHTTANVGPGRSSMSSHSLSEQPPTTDSRSSIPRRRPAQIPSSLLEVMNAGYKQNGGTAPDQESSAAGLSRLRSDVTVPPKLQPRSQSEIISSTVQEPRPPAAPLAGRATMSEVPRSSAPSLDGIRALRKLQLPNTLLSSGSSPVAGPSSATSQTKVGPPVFRTNKPFPAKQPAGRASPGVGQPVAAFGADSIASMSQPAYGASPYMPADQSKASGSSSVLVVPPADKSTSGVDEAEVADLLEYPDTPDTPDVQMTDGPEAPLELRRSKRSSRSSTASGLPRQSSRRPSSSASSSAGLVDLVHSPRNEPAVRIHDGEPEAAPDPLELLGESLGFTMTTWTKHRKQMAQEFAPFFQLAENIPHEIEDRMNALPAYAREASNMQVLVFEACISENTAEDEPFAPPIRVVNDVDDELTPPYEFHYSNLMWHGEGVPRPDLDNIVGCDCDGRCDPRSTTCPCALRQRKYWDLGGRDAFIYDANGRLRAHEYPIFECNDFCKCGPECTNRVVQHGRKYPVNIRKTKDKGWGVFAAHKKIPANTFIGVYAGEYLTDDKGEERGTLYNKFGRTYLFDLDFHYLKADNPDWSTQYCVDAYHAGNFTRYLNHSCDPNCNINACYINEANLEKPLLTIFTMRDVNPGQELCFSYFGRVDDEDEEDPDESNLNDAVHVPCRCGAVRCTGKMWKS